MDVQATELHQQQKWVEAERCYRQVLQVSPNNADALHQLGALLVQHHGAKQVSPTLYLARLAHVLQLLAALSASVCCLSAVLLRKCFGPI